MAPIAALLQEDCKTARSGYRQPGNAFIDGPSDPNHPSSLHVKRPPLARNTGERGVSVDHKVDAAKEPAPRL